jgi:hypothetical protein
MDYRSIVLGVFLAVLFVLFFWRLRTLLKYSRMRRRMQEEIDSFLTNFNPSEFAMFDAFDFQKGSFSHVSPFPHRVNGEWRYTIYLANPETEDVNTIVHEVVECTLGRIVEKSLDLKKPLYLQRKQDDKFWVSGQKQKYILEHLLATIAEFNDLPKEKQTERIAPEDILTWKLNE